MPPYATASPPTPPRHAKNQAFRQQQPDQPETPGAHRQPHGDFTGSGAGTAQKKSRNVGARHQQDRQREDRADHEELPGTRSGIVSSEHFELGAHRRAAIAIELWIVAFEVLREQGEFTVRLPRRRAPLQARLHTQLAIVPVLEEVFLRVGRKHRRHGERHVEIGIGEYLHSRERVRRHANHREVPAVQANRPADHPRVAGEFVLPEVRPQHHHGIAAGRLIFVVPKRRAPAAALHRAHGSSCRKPSFRPWPAAWFRDRR